jgi:hypothetical protein
LLWWSRRRLDQPAVAYIRRRFLRGLSGVLLLAAPLIGLAGVAAVPFADQAVDQQWVAPLIVPMMLTAIVGMVLTAIHRRRARKQAGA